MPNLTETAREEVVGKADEAGTPAPEGAEATAAATPPPAEGEGKPEGDATPEATPAEETPSFSDEDVAKFASDQRIVDAVLKGTGKDQFDAIIREVLAEKETTARVVAVQAEQARTMEEAVRLGEEEGDWTALGQLVGKQYRESMAAKPIVDRVTKEVTERSETEFVADLNEAATAVYGDVIETLTEEDYGKLDRGHFNSRREWITGVYRFLDSKRQDMLKSASGEAVSTAEEVAATATAAAKAREAGGVSALPGGTGVEQSAGGDSVGSLIRSAMRDSYQYEE